MTRAEGGMEGGMQGGMYSKGTALSVCTSHQLLQPFWPAGNTSWLLLRPTQLTDYKITAPTLEAGHVEDGTETSS